MDAGDGRRRGRRPALNRETLRDLSPTDAEAATVRGAQVMSFDQPCDFPVLGPRRLDRTTTSISGDDCGPGRWVVDWRVQIVHEVFKDGTVQVRAMRAENEPPEQIKDRDRPLG